MPANISPLYQRLFDRINRMPVIDTHEHLRGPVRDLPGAPRDPLLRLAVQYYGSDLWSADENGDYACLLDESRSLDERWPVFERLWGASQHTAYARVSKIVMRRFYGIERFDRTALEKISAFVAAQDESSYLQLMTGAGIRAVIPDNLVTMPVDRMVRYYHNPVLQDFLAGRFPMPPGWYPSLNIPYLHEIRLRDFINFIGLQSGIDIISLKDYEEALYVIVRRCKERGVIALKDQSAYRRIISYDLPPTSEAEKLFNSLLIDPRSQLAWPEAKPLDDYLFHHLMRIARDLDLPVQIHTGHMAMVPNRVDKANAAHFAPVMELHSQVRFDLFHGNWPYLGDALYLGKNYANVRLNLCWVHMIDPLYSQEMLQRAVMTIPHTKIHGFGGDYFHAPEFSVAHLELARDNITRALAGLVESGWLEEEEALQLAADWLYNNPNRFYRLGLPDLAVDS